jgi:hypothetical protein
MAPVGHDRFKQILRWQMAAFPLSLPNLLFLLKAES